MLIAKHTKTNLARLWGKSETEIDELIIELELNADGFILAYTKGIALATAVMNEARGLYVQWKLYAIPEWENVSKDKYNALIELLTVATTTAGSGSSSGAGAIINTRGIQVLNDE